MLGECECIWLVQWRNIIMMMVKAPWTLSSWCCTKSQATVSRKVSSCVCVWEILFFFFLCRVCYAPKQICPYQRHGRHSSHHGDWVWVAAKLPFSHVLFVFCVRILRASVQVCVCVFLSTIHAHLRCLIALGYIHIRCLLARKRDCDCN